MEVLLQALALRALPGAGRAEQDEIELGHRGRHFRERLQMRRNARRTALGVLVATQPALSTTCTISELDGLMPGRAKVGELGAIALERLPVSVKLVAVELDDDGNSAGSNRRGDRRRATRPQRSGQRDEPGCRRMVVMALTARVEA